MASSRLPTNRAECARIIDACLRDEPGAWEDLQRRYSPFVYSICLRVTQNRTWADDAFQATFVELWRNLSHLRMDYTLTGWIGKLAVSQATRALRLPAGRKPEPKPTPKELRLGDPQELFARLEHLQILREAMNAIPPACKKLLSSVFLAEESPGYKALSSQLRIAVGTIGAKRARCLAFLRRELEGLKPGFIEEFSG
ncbi:MAG: sigma-70 family RNA polymerase sigma factor [Planctomycetes bacterium]|nr:sigma-70 family RNA polymerase sigma factor [Planctomycetota bacterium]